MIKVNVSPLYVKEIEHKLGRLKAETQKVLAKAVNVTAKQARKELQTEAKKTYTVKASKFNKAMKIKNATKSRQEATIIAKGSTMPLSDFKITPKAPVQNGTDAASAKVLKANKIKSLVLGGGEKSGKDLKAFVAKFASGHVAVVQRVPGKKMKSKNKEALKEFYSVSIPKMIGNEKRVYGKVKPVISNNLKANIDIQIKKVIGE